MPTRCAPGVSRNERRPGSRHGDAPRVGVVVVTTMSSRPRTRPRARRSRSFDDAASGVFRVQLMNRIRRARPPAGIAPEVGLETTARRQRHRTGSARPAAGPVVYDRITGVARKRAMSPGSRKHGLTLATASLAPIAKVIMSRGPACAGRRGVERRHRVAVALAPTVGGVLVGPGGPTCARSASTSGSGVGVSGSPMPSEMTSTPSARFAAFFCLIWAKKVRGEPPEPVRPRRRGSSPPARA